MAELTEGCGAFFRLPQEADDGVIGFRLSALADCCAYREMAPHAQLSVHAVVRIGVRR